MFAADGDSGYFPLYKSFPGYFQQSHTVLLPVAYQSKWNFTIPSLLPARFELLVQCFLTPAAVPDYLRVIHTSQTISLDNYITHFIYPKNNTNIIGAP